MIRRAAAAGCLTLVAALSLGACSDDGDGGAGGSSSSAPDDASLEDFCGAFNGLFDEVMAEAASGDSTKMVRALKDWAAEIEEVGTPADMPEDARNGFELFVEQARGVDEDATLADLERLGEGLSEAEQADGEAFSDWTTESCPLDLPELPGS